MKIMLLIPILFILSPNKCQSQTLSTKETKVVLVVSSQTHSVTQIVLYHTFENMTNEEVLKKYKGSKFYVGLLKGSYELNNNNLEPKDNTTIVVFTEKRIFPVIEFFPAEDLAPGDSIELGKAKAKVVSNKKGELILKT